MRRRRLQRLLYGRIFECQGCEYVLREPHRFVAGPSSIAVGVADQVVSLMKILTRVKRSMLGLMA